MNIHPLAVVNPDAHLGRDVVVEPFCVIEAGVHVGDGCRLESRVVLKQGTILGENNHVCEGAVIGALPQHVKKPENPGGLVIGSHNTVRENVTVHRALKAGNVTAIGDHNLLMVNAHVAHDCLIGSNVILGNNVMLAGHVLVEDRAFLSGGAGVHQFCRIGRMAMVGGQAHVVQDVPPYMTIDGASGYVVGLNTVGLRRNGVTPEQIADLKAAYRLIYRSGLRLVEIQQRLREEFAEGPAAYFHDFLAASKRGFIRERRVPRTPTTIKLPEAAEAVAELKSKAG